MPVRRDPRTKRWFFRATIKHADGTRERIFGTPGMPGPFQDLAPTKVGATEAENRAKAQALHGKPVLAPQPKEVPTIREASVTFMAGYNPGQKPSERRSKKQILNGHLLPFFGELRVDSVKQTDVDAFATQELKRCSIKTVNNRLGVLSSLIRYATGEKPKLTLNLDGMTGELAAVPMAQVERLLSASKDDRHRAAVLLAAEAGLRAGEIRGLQWGDVQDGVITVRRSLDNETNDAVAPKHNKLRTVPASQRLLSTLAGLPRRGLWVVSRLDGGALGYDGLREAVAGLYDRAGVARPPKVIHCLRHTFGTEMAKQAPLGVLQRLMGHADITTTLRYVDVDEGQKRDAIAAVFGGRGSHVAAASENAG